ncbi:hypothetical protein C8R46DRAFT_1238672 [Mycena filopes]|nr:hypothetical protein C8R46DRAFT_1238672 [Mycena filopes]
MSEIKMTPTNLRAEDLVMDIRGGGRDSRYYCLPPYHGRPDAVPAKGKSGYPLHLVAQGHKVGIFDNWLEAKTSLAGFPDSSNRGYNTIDECVEAWQQLCLLGIHPHPVDPARLEPAAIPPGTAGFVNTSPRKRRTNAVDLKPFVRARSPLPGPRKTPQSPPPSPRKTPQSPPPNLINFAIRGDGIISSSAARSEERYREAQERGEEPDLLVTRSFARASRFALDEENEGGAG